MHTRVAFEFACAPRKGRPRRAGSILNGSTTVCIILCILLYSSTSRSMHIMHTLVLWGRAGLRVALARVLASMHIMHTNLYTTRTLEYA